MKYSYYFGHHKCATNWMRRLFRDLCEQQSWNYEVVGGLNKSLTFPDASKSIHMFVNATPKDPKVIEDDDRGFHLIRDPRDAMVSGYWSWKNSHKNNDQKKLEVREKLLQLSVEDGLLEMVDHISMLRGVKSWEFGQYKNVLETKYENLLQDPQVHFRKIFDHLEIYIDESALSCLIEKHSFKKIANRKPGNEDVNSHYRKGIAGDWKNCFTDKLKEKFKERHGNVLIKLGYEEDFNW